jgi:hypothetical protein
MCLWFRAQLVACIRAKLSSLSSPPSSTSAKMLTSLAISHYCTCSKGCKPDFHQQSCDLDEATGMTQFKMIPMDHVDWPLDDYEQDTPQLRISVRNSV